VDFIDPLVRLNCPWCGQQMHYESTAPDAQFYFCFKHGRVALRANWHFTLVPDDSEFARAETPRFAHQARRGRATDRPARPLAT
jgi:hypothetical protein